MSYDPNSPYEVETTDTPLLSGATFTSQVHRSESAAVLVQTYADEQGTLYIDFSIDGTNFDITYPVGGFLCKAAEGSAHTVKVDGRYYRVRYINNGTNQTVFRLGIYESTDGQMRAAINQRTSPDHDAIVVRPTVAQDEVVRGLRDGESSFSAVSERTDLDTADGNALITSDNTTNTPTILTTASTFTIAYNNATDGSGTTGALYLLFTYLDANQDIATAIHILGNTGSDVTAFSGLGINRVAVVLSGTSQNNVNDITITATTGGSVQSFIAAGISFSKQALSHIPRNSLTSFKYLYFSAVRPSGSTPVVTFRLYVHSRAANTTYESFVYHMNTDAETSRELVDPTGFVINEGSVLYATAETTVNNTQVACTFSYNTYEDLT